MKKNVLCVHILYVYITIYKKSFNVISGNTNAKQTDKLKGSRRVLSNT